jgi:hypothetical protein
MRQGVFRVSLGGLAAVALELNTKREPGIKPKRTLRGILGFIGWLKVYLVLGDLHRTHSA